MLYNEKIAAKYPSKLYAVELLLVSFYYLSYSSQGLTQVFSQKGTWAMLCVLWGDFTWSDEDLSKVYRLDGIAITVWMWSRAIGCFMEFFIHLLLNLDLYRIVRDPFMPQSDRTKGYWTLAIPYLIMVIILHSYYSIGDPRYVYISWVVYGTQYFLMVYFLCRAVNTLLYQGTAKKLRKDII